MNREAADASQVGDVVTTAEELDALPRHAAVVMHDIEGSLLAVRDTRCWHTLGMDPLSSADLFDISVDPEEGGPIPVTLVYLPGQPPRPERVVKAEALREWVALVERAYPEDVFIPPTPERLAQVHEFCKQTGGTLDAISAHVMRHAARIAGEYADSIERGEP